MTKNNIKHTLNLLTAIARGKIMTAINYSRNFTVSDEFCLGAKTLNSYHPQTIETISGMSVSNDRFHLPLTPQEVENLRSENRKLRALATMDPLTGLNNRRAFFEHVEDHIANLIRRDEKRKKLNADIKRESDESVLIYIDLYDFSAVNNHLGHKIGDEALKIVSEVLIKQSRRSDFPARIGGDEFAILVSNTRLEKANILVNRLRNSFDNLSMNWEGKNIKLMATIGAAVMDTKLSVDDNLEKADRSMYDEKARQREEHPKAGDIHELLARSSNNLMGVPPQMKHQMPLNFS